MPEPSTNERQPKSQNITGWATVVLLAAILAMQVVLLMRGPTAPPTIGAIRHAKSQQARRTEYESIPVVYVQGGAIDADVTGTVDVNVENEPLEVEIYR